MSEHVCANCGKTEAGATHGAGDRRYDALPVGWLRWQDWFCGELSAERIVCSTTCADTLPAKEEAEAERDRAEYVALRTARQARIADGTATDEDRSEEQMAEMQEQMIRLWADAHAATMTQRLADDDYYSGVGPVAHVHGTDKLLFAGEIPFRKIDLPDSVKYDMTAPEKLKT